MIDYNAIGKRIRRARRLVDITQADLAKATGVSPAFIGHIERGTRKMSLETFCDICNTLHLSADYAAFGIGTDPNEETRP